MSGRPARDGAWGAAARDWAEVQEGTQRPVFERVRIVPASGRAVLDVACGTGGFLMLARARGAGLVAGLDAWQASLRSRGSVCPAPNCVKGRWTSLPFAGDTFDLVSISLALQYANDAVQALREMWRVAHPGATIAVITTSRSGERGASGVTFGALAPFREVAAAAADRPSPARAIFTEPGALERFIGEAGLTIYEDEEVDTDWDYPDLDTALRGVLSYAPGVRAIRMAGQDAVYAAVSTALEPYRTPTGGYHLANRSRYMLTRAE